MAAANGARALAREDLQRCAWLFGVTFALQVALSVAVAASSGMPLPALAAYNDGHLYLEIAKSFPLPYAAEGPHYLGHAPGYPALIAAVHALTPDAWVDWGTAALLASWLPAALSAIAFYALCLATGVPPLWPTLFFVAANPFHVLLGASAHAEPAAGLFAILCFVAFARDRLGWSVAWLSVAALCRFPAILLGAPLAFGVLVLRGRRDLRSVATLGVPLLVFALFNLYLRWRVPGFSNVFESHAIFWDAPFRDAFSAIATLAAMGATWREEFPLWAIWINLAVYALALVAGLRPGERERWPLALWVGVIAGFHAALGGVMGALALPRMMILAWPPSVLILARFVGPRSPRATTAALCALLAIASFALARDVLSFVTRAQAQTFLPDVIARIHDDEPHWIDFEAWRAERRRELREERRLRRAAPQP